MRKYVGLLVLLIGLVSIGLAQAVNVPTYHNNNLRNGWNFAETVLTPTNVNASTFGLLHTVAVDGQVDAQPLVVASETIGGISHQVVYVATSNNTVYAIDGVSGAILLQRNLGPQVPSPSSCKPTPTLGGILSTPTLSIGAQRIYVMDYTLINNVATHRLHALSLSTLQDVVTPATVRASDTLANGSTTQFNATWHRQRPALLQANGVIYAAFGDACKNDFPANLVRGWLLGWNANTLAPLASNELTNSLASNPGNYFLTSIWMSGYGPAADALNNIYFVTGNSDPHQDTYNGTSSIQESAVKVPPNLSTVSDLFTPSNVFTLDQHDLDFGSGGIMVLPDQPGPITHLATAAGKDGRMWILNRDDMGGFQTTDVPPFINIGRCFCGQSYYNNRVVTSGGVNNSSGQSITRVSTYRINTNLVTPLTLEASSAYMVPTKQQPGTFTSVSSNGNSNPIIWTVARPTGTDNHLTLYAFNGTASSGTLATLWSGTAGFWNDMTQTAFTVATVANGYVYVGSYKMLDIFGLKQKKT